MRIRCSALGLLPAATLAVVIALGALAAPAQAQIPSNGVIYACIRLDRDQDEGKLVRLVADDEPCRRNETRVRWNVVGPTGATGATGAPGVAGAKGATGGTGATGAAGAPGAAGAKGSTGATGSAGPAGATGANGINGTNGATGAPGTNGINGLNGATGATGATDRIGPAGANGIDGAPGAQGFPGPQGAQGPAGSPGGINGQLQSCTVGFNYAGILVHIPGRAFSVFTGSDGHFQIDNVPNGVYTLSIESAGAVLASVTGVPVGSAPYTLASNVLISNVSGDTNNCGACGVACGTGACVSGACQAPAATCSDAQKNGAETDVDCGGGTCGACAVGKTCLVNSDCASGACTGGQCVAPPPTAKRMFVSAGLFRPRDFGGYAGADQKCQGEAANANLGGSWKAWLSDSNSSPALRFTRSALPYRLLDGTLMANNWDDLTAGAGVRGMSGVYLNAHGVPRGDDVPVWTATDPNGTYAASPTGNSCDNFTTSIPSASAFVGRMVGGISWTVSSYISCDNYATLYCVEQ